VVKNMLPNLPEDARYGAEMIFSFEGKNEFHAPAGFVIKSLDKEKKIAICVPIQVYSPELDTWVVIGAAD